ncbi:S8 family serine peptidase [Rugosimonospora acidiphila]|uniref:S8 family serine peptidase n=1 Tax=Rugosimonospora acidiphila TaxID=556531 RepID=UPI0031EFBA63
MLIGLWAAAGTVVLQTGSWLAGQVLGVEELSPPGWAWPAVGWLNAITVGVPAVLLATVPRPLTSTRTAVRAVGRLWTLGAVLLGVLGSLRAVALPHNTLYLLLLTAVCLAAWLVLRRTYHSTPLRGAPYRPALPRDGSALFGLAAGLASLAPWLWLGALGGGLETLFALTAAAALGLLVAWPLAAPFWRNFTDSRRRLIVLGGLAAGVFLALVAAGTGASGIQLGELVVLPPLGFAAAALAREPLRRPKDALRTRVDTERANADPSDAETADAGASDSETTGAGAIDAGTAGRRTTGVRRVRGGLRLAGPSAIAVMVALAALGPLGFVEPLQTSLVINLDGRDVGYWALIAAGCALVIGLLCGVGPLVRGGRPAGKSGARAAGGTGRRWVAVSTAVAMGATGLVGYATIGSPGLHGDELFVVMRTQADLSDLSRIADPDDRRTEAYQRLVATANRTQAGLRQQLSRLHLAYTPYYLVNGIEVDGGPAARAWLSGRSDVNRVLLAPRLRPVPAGSSPVSPDAPAPKGPQWNIKMIEADQVWATGDTGRGIVIGTSDSGVDAGVPALAGSFRGGDDSWYDPWNGTRAPTDHIGHGTHTIATALGRDGVGVAPGAQWIGCVDLARNLGNPGYYLGCLQFMLAPFPHGGNPLRDGDPSRGADVLTNSWGCPSDEGCDPGSLRPAVDALTDAGIFVVASAGNTGPRCGSITDPPAPYQDTFTVGAVDGSGDVADFSSRGPVTGERKPDVLAPGANVVSAVPGGYAVLSGTSMAAPHVAGVVALMWSANPDLIGDVARTAQILRQTATGASADGCGGNAGIVDAYAAVRSATGSA